MFFSLVVWALLFSHFGFLFVSYSFLKLNISKFYRHCSFFYVLKLFLNGRLEEKLFAMTELYHMHATRFSPPRVH